jgi:hypothetical protein
MRCNAEWTKREAGDRGEVVEGWDSRRGEREERGGIKEKRGKEIERVLLGRSIRAKSTTQSYTH